MNTQFNLKLREAVRADAFYGWDPTFPRHQRRRAAEVCGVCGLVRARAAVVVGLAKAETFYQLEHLHAPRPTPCGIY